MVFKTVDLYTKVLTSDFREYALFLPPFEKHCNFASKNKQITVL